MAVLILGAACGDEEKAEDQETDAGSDAGGGHAHDDGGEDHVDHDAAGHDEPDAGGNGGGSDAGAGADIDVGDTRIQEVATDFCKTAFACREERQLQYDDDEAECRADMASYWRDYVDTYGADCIDAQLDLYACYALSLCDEDVDSACTTEVATAAGLCPVADD
jgi:hypothetical protein